MNFDYFNLYIELKNMIFNNLKQSFF